MASTLQEIAAQLIATTSAGQLTLDNSVIDSDYLGSLLGLIQGASFVVQVSAADPGTDIYVQGDTLYVTGTATIWKAPVSSFVLQVQGQAEAERTVTLAGTLGSLALSDLATLGLLNDSGATELLPPATLTNLALQAQAGSNSATPQLTLTATGSSSTWPLLSDLGLTLSLDPMGVLVQLTPDAQSVGITGTSSVGGSLSGTLTASVTVPATKPTTATWALSMKPASGTGTTGLNDAALTTLLGGTNALGQLPAVLIQQVQQAANFTLQNLVVNFDPTAGQVQTVAVTLGSPNVWPLANTTLQLNGLQTTFTVQKPLSLTPSLTVVVGGQLQIGSPQNVLNATMQLAASGADWQLQTTGQFSLDSFSALSQLPLLGGLSSVQLPTSIAATQVKLNDFTVAYNPGINQLDYLQVNVQVQGDWPILGAVSFAQPTLMAYVPVATSTKSPVVVADSAKPLTVTGSTQLLLPGNVTLLLKASYVASATGASWTFAGTQLPGQPLNVVQLAAYLLGISVNPDSSLNLDTLTVSNLAASVTWNPSTSVTQYAFAGQTSTWSLSFGELGNLSVQATVALAYNSSTGTSASVSGAIQLLGLAFTVSYELKQNTKQLTLQWQGITFSYNGSDDTITASATGSDWTLGSLLTALVNEINPNTAFSLPEPWNLLNSVSLSGLSVSFDLKKKILTIACPLPVSLFFIDITSLNLTVQNGQVGVSLDATFLGKQAPVQWDAANADPPAVPGSGSDLFDLTFAAFGQHVSIGELPDTVADFFTPDNLKLLVPPDQTADVVPIAAGGTGLQFSDTSGWLVAADFTLAKFYTLQVLFADPTLYGLRIGIADGAQYFKNLDFEILYKKISDTLGLYQLELQLPDQFRHLEFGEVSVTLPNIGIKVYTNGNFYLDFGFPASLTDFSRSFSIQVFPFTGYGGFYFGYLSGATSTSVPKTSLGQFNPVIEAGLGLSLGVGKTINEGILSAGLSLTAVGIFQGVLGFFTRYTPNDKGLTTDTYYRFDAVVALVGHVYGSINFAIISAQFDITAYVSAALTIESYMPIPITFSAGVSVSLTVKINLGLFKISISLQFSTTITASFSIGSDTSNQALWYDGQAAPQARLTPQQRVQRALLARGVSPESFLGLPGQDGLAALATQPATVTLQWNPLVLGQTSAKQLTAYFIPHLTVSAAGQAAYVAMLYLDAPAPTATGADTSSFGTLASGVLAWALNALLNSPSYASLLTEQVTADDVQLLLCAFDSQPNNVPPFGYQDVESFVQAFFGLNLVASATTTNEEYNATVLPPLPGLTLQTSLNGATTVVSDFAQVNPVDSDYIAALTNLLQTLAVSNETQLAADSGNCSGVASTSSAAPASQSLPAFFFADYVALLAKNMLQNSFAYLNSLGHDAQQTVSQVLDNVCTAPLINTLAGMASRFLLHGLRLPAPTTSGSSPLGTVAPLYVLTGQQFNLPGLVATDNYQVQLLKDTSMSWVTLGGSATDTTLAVTIDSNEISRLNQVGTISQTLAPTLQSAPVPLPNYTDKPQHFTLGSPATWNYPGTYFQGVAGPPTLFKLPATLQAELASGQAPSDFSLWPLAPPAATTTVIPAPVQVQHYYWATSVALTVQRLSPGGVASPLQANTYSLVGADDVGVAFLQHLVKYLYTGDPSLTGTVQLLYQPDPATATTAKGGFLSAPNNGTKLDQVSMAVVQANLSTETNPTQGGDEFFVDFVEQDPIVPNTLNSFTDFVTLLWKCSIVRSGGYYLYYSDLSNGGAGLPDTLFDAHGTAQVQVLITFASFVAQPFLNCLVVGDQFSDPTTQVYAQSPSLLVRSATLLPGTVGYSLQRQDPGEYAPSTQPPSAQDDAVYLENQFNLIGTTLAGLPAYQNLLPAGPVDEFDPATGNSSAVAGVWPYQRVIPYYQLMQADTGFHEFDDPYAGVGTTASIVLNWQDMFGNTLPLATASATVPVTPLYTDPLLAVSQWPSTTAGYSFAGAASSPQVALCFVFATSRYTGSDAKSNQDNAGIDLQTWLRLWFQLQHLPDVSASFAFSLDGTATNPQGSDRSLNLSTLQASFVQPVVDYLYAVATAAATTPPAPADYKVTSDIAPATISTYANIFPLTASLTLRRTNYVDPNFAAVAGVSSAITTLTPTSDTLLALATQFEQAFNTATGVQLKLAASANLSAASSTPGAAPLWVVRFDPSGQQGLSVAYQQDAGGQPLSAYYAPPPLATSLRAFSANVQGYPAAATTTINYSGIDLDVWAQQLLTAIDSFLTPTYAVPAFLLDKGVMLNELLACKKALAGHIADSVTNILASDAVQPDGLPNAQEKWHQQLLIQLSAAYAYTAAVQTPVTVASAWQGPNTDPPQAGSPPRLYGQMIGTPPLDAQGDLSTTFGQGFSLSAAKLPIATGKSWLTYLFQCKEAAGQPNFPFGDMQFAISHIEWQYEDDGVADYLGSSWLNLLLPASMPLPASYTQVGTATPAQPASVTMPVPLRAYPTPPSVTQQTATHPSVAYAASADDSVLEARSWDFGFAYQISGASQDTVGVQIQFNATASAKPTAGPQGPDALLTLEQALAQFMYTYPAIRADFDAYLVPQGKPDTAGAAVQAFSDLVKNAVNAWPAHTSAQRMLRQSAQLTTSILNFQVEESSLDSDDPNSHLVVSVTPADQYYAQLAVDIAGYKRHDAPSDTDTYKYVYTSTTDPTTYLSYADRGTVTTRQLTLPDRDILREQNGWAGLQIIRNQELLPGETTNQAFVYRTPLVMAITPLTPLFTSNTPIDIAQLTLTGATSTTQVAPRSLNDNMQAFAAALTQQLPTSITSLSIKLVCEYQYELASGPYITLPIALTITDLPTDQANQQTNFVAPLTSQLSDWYQQMHPVDTEAQWLFNVSIFSLYDTGPPVLQLAFKLALADEAQDDT